MTEQPYIRMHSGTNLVLANPQPDDIHIKDVAVHLSRVARFGGASILLYVVAQHSTLVVDILKTWRQPAHVQMWGLLHDAHEAAFGDTTTPLKRYIESLHPEFQGLFKKITAPFDTALQRKLNLLLTAEELQWVDRADKVALATEWRDLMIGPCPEPAQPMSRRVIPLNTHRAEENFIKTYNTLARHLNLPDA